MKEFARLYQSLDETTKTTVKVEAMCQYFARCDPADGAWAVHFLSGRRFKRLLTSGNLRRWCAELAEIPDWLFEECYGAVGDLAETISLLLPPASSSNDRSLHEWIATRIEPLRKMDESSQRDRLIASWGELEQRERFVFTKLITGGFRVGVSQGLVIRALAEVSHNDKAVIAHRLMGNWQPTAEFFNRLLADDDGSGDISRPYPFCLAHPLQEDPATLGDVSNWLIDWKWDGIRAQIIKRQGQGFIWSRGEELIGERFPDLEPIVNALPNSVVLDGEIVAWKNGGVLPFGELQRRIGRKNVGKKLLQEVPARFVAFDLLEHNGDDVRPKPMSLRRELLVELIANCGDDLPIAVSPELRPKTWEEAATHREHSRKNNVEGLMLKRTDAPYEVGRTTGVWWKWKIEPYTCDAVLIYAQRGHGRRASLYTDYTFAAWNDGDLVPFAKAYSGLTDAEIREVDRFVRKHTLEKFGPVRSVKPELVFELAFENIRESSRHKSGIAVRFPRILRWRHDKKPADADTLKSIRALVGNEPME